MKNKSLLALSALTLLLSIPCMNVMASDPIDVDDFVKDASAAGIAEIDAGKLALQKSRSAAVKKFAQEMIDDHTAANKELADIAHSKNLKIATDEALIEKAKEYALKQHEGESFDDAYAKNQVKAHEKAVALFQKGAKSSDPQISAYASATLPKLEQHLHMAHDLEATTTTIKSNKNK